MGKILYSAPLMLVLGCGSAQPTLVTAEKPMKIVGTAEKKEEVKVEKLERNEDLSELVKELGKFDIVHFGEAHPGFHPNEQLVGTVKETSTLQDFVSSFLPLLRNPDLVGKPYDLIRSEGLPFEDLFYDGLASELSFIDQNHTLSGKYTPVFYNLVVSSGANKDPKGNFELVKHGSMLGYKVRGIAPPLSFMNNLVAEGVAKLRGEGATDQEIQNTTVHALISLITFHNLKTVEKDTQTNQRIIMYGGALHNDDNDPMKYGIADEMEAQFPGKYASVDIVKNSVIPRNPYTDEFNYMLRNHDRSPSSLTKPFWLKLEDNLKADYVVFLPPNVSEGLQCGEER
jgi:hypothetical protein